LADYDEPATLHRKFVRYLDKGNDIRDWRLLYRELQHRDLQWWADRLEDVRDGEFDTLKRISESAVEAAPKE